MSRNRFILAAVVSALTWVPGPAVLADTTMKMPSMSASGSQTVKIVRDKMGVAHIYADTTAALFYGAAYANAQDRLAEGEVAIRRALGRSAEIFGADAVAGDREMRRKIMSDAEAQAQFRSLSKQHQEILSAMYRGWMDYAAEVRRDPQRLPYEFKEWGIQPTEWSLWDFLNTMSWNFGRYTDISGREASNLDYYLKLVEKFGTSKARAIFEDTMPLNDPDSITTVSAEEDRVPPPKSPTLFEMQAGLPVTKHAALPRQTYRSMSRCFIIGKSHTASGFPIVFQATADGPTIHLSGAGVNVAGWFWSPFSPMLMGRSNKFGFFMTATGDDVSDVFAEKLNPENPKQYWRNGAWRNVETRPQTILVKGSEPIHFEIEYTSHGPIIGRIEQSNIAYAQKHAMRGAELAGLAAFIDTNLATDYSQWKQAVQRNTFSFNFFYAGEDGTIAFVNSGNVPIRAPGIDPRLPTPGTGEYEWRGFVPPEQHPQVVNPKQDYIFNWNSKTSRNWMEGDAIHYGKAFRAWMPPQLIKGKPTHITVADAREFHRMLGQSNHDMSATNPKFFTPYLRVAVGDDPLLRKVVDTMDSWNAVYEDRDGDGYYDNPGLTIFRKWVEVARKAIVDDDIGSFNVDLPSYAPNVLLRAVQGKDAGLPMKYDWFNGQDPKQVLRKTVADTARSLEAQFATDDVSAWKQKIFYRYYDCSAIGQNPDKPQLPEKTCAGGSDGLGVANLQTAARLGLQPKYVPDNLSESWATLMEISPNNKALRDVTPTGGANMFIDTSGHGNPNISDQVELARTFDFKIVDLEKSKVMAGAVSTVTLSYSAVQP